VSRRSMVSKGVVAGIGLALVALAVPAPAGAIVAPIWPAAGYLPKCDSVSATSAPPPAQYILVYEDTTGPTVGPVTFARGATRAVVGPNGTPLTFRARMKDSCSGVAGASAVGRLNGAFVGSVTLLPDVNNGRYFDVTVTSAPQTLGPASAGAWTFNLVQVVDRFSEFVLDQDHKWYPGGETASTNTYWREPSGGTLYVLKKTRSTISTSKSRVRAGAKVTVKGSVDIATPGTYADYAAGKVKLQAKIGSGKWKTLATKTTSGTGAVSASVKVSRTTAYRWSVVEKHSGLFAAASNSPSVTVKAS
jgi:hypothetical protein